MHGTLANLSCKGICIQSGPCNSARPKEMVTDHEGWLLQGSQGLPLYKGRYVQLWDVAVGDCDRPEPRLGFEWYRDAKCVLKLPASYVVQKSHTTQVTGGVCCDELKLLLKARSA